MLKKSAPCDASLFKNLDIPNLLALVGQVVVVVMVCDQRGHA